MANIGEKRPVTQQKGPENVQDSDRLEEETVPSAPKRPAPSGFNFRPSPLQQATQGFSLKQSSFSSASGGGESSNSVVTSLQGGFLKLDANELKPIAIDSVPLGVPAASGAFCVSDSSERDAYQVNHGGNQTTNNLFLQFLARTSTAQTFSTLSTTPSPSTRISTGTLTNASTSNEEGSTPSLRDENQTDIATVESDIINGASGTINSTGPPFGFQGTSAILPEVQIVTGEEKEKKIVQIPARLYVFDRNTHTWKERGRGEARLNDAAQSEGLFQSRLVMRISGSYRILLNTHLWAQMKCERANQKSIRITAQYGDQGEVGVFLIMGASKDIQQLFTAIDRRIEALRRNISTDTERDNPNISQEPPRVPFDDDDKESFLDEPHSSPDSSPDCHVSSRTRLRSNIKTVAITSKIEENDAAGKECKVETKKNKEEDGTKERSESSKNLTPSDGGETVVSDKESTTATPPSSRSPSLGASTTTISSSDNAPETI